MCHDDLHLLGAAQERFICLKLYHLECSGLKQTLYKYINNKAVRENSLDQLIIRNTVEYCGPVHFLEKLHRVQHRKYSDEWHLFPKSTVIFNTFLYKTSLGSFWHQYSQTKKKLLIFGGQKISSTNHICPFI